MTEPTTTSRPASPRSPASPAAAPAPPRASRVAALLGRAAVGAIVLGVAAAYSRLLPPLGGFLLLALAIPLSLAGIVQGVRGMRAAASVGVPILSRPVLEGTALSALALLVILLPASRAGGLPRINDITTDFDDPPAFVRAPTLAANLGRDMDYPGAEFRAQQAPAYPDLGPLITEGAPEALFDRVAAAVGSLPGTEVTDTDLETGRIEATSESALFHFVDDFVVRVRANGDGRTRIDARSKSRDGKGDMGANAARIEALFAMLYCDKCERGKAAK